MKLLYLCADNLRNPNFIKDLVWNFKDVGKAILLHDHFGSISDTRFVTKRISALMSEEMIVNNPLSGDQRNILTEKEGQIIVNVEFLNSIFKTIDLVILNPIALQGDDSIAAKSFDVAKAIRSVYGLEEIFIFPSNPRSPLASERRVFASTSDAEFEKLLAVYEEESQAIESAQALAPSVLASPTNFLRQAKK